MHKIKSKLMEALYEYEDKMAKMSSASLTMQDIEKIHKLTDTIKNIDKIEMLEDGGYSEDGHYMGEGRIYGTSYDGGSSYARGRNANRDSRGRYSNDGGSSYMRGGHYSYDGAKDHLIKKAEEMLSMAQDHKEKQAIEKFIRELEG